MGKINKTNMIAVLAITSLIFFTGFAIGNWSTSFKINELRLMQEELNLNSIELETQYAIAGQNPCDITGLQELNRHLTDFGDRVAYLEAKAKQGELDVSNIDRYYAALEAKHMLFILQVNEQCDANYPYILYFYSVSKDDIRKCDICSLQGLTLTAIKKEYPTVMIYSFNYYLDSEIVSSLKRMHNISQTPTLIINGLKYEGYQDKSTILGYLNTTS